MYSNSFCTSQCLFVLAWWLIRNSVSGSPVCHLQKFIMKTPSKDYQDGRWYTWTQRLTLIFSLAWKQLWNYFLVPLGNNSSELQLKNWDCMENHSLNTKECKKISSTPVWCRESLNSILSYPLNTKCTILLSFTFSSAVYSWSLFSVELTSKQGVLNKLFRYQYYGIKTKQ